MNKFARMWVLGVLLFSILVPTTASAALISFGGRVIATLPCLNGAIYTSVFSARGATPGLTEFYVWTPATLTFVAGPPRNPGQQILGTADVPYPCVISVKPPIVLYGLRMFMVGTSGAF
jgi:hypothetical protein